MKTPNLIRDAKNDPFAQVPEPLRTSEISVLFATDRFPEQKSSNSSVSFGADRSSHLHVGRCILTVGDDLSWEELVDASVSGRRSRKHRLSIGEPDVVLRYPGTFWRSARIDDPSRDYEHFLQRRVSTREEVHRLIDEWLDVTQDKEAFIFVHGYNNDFNDAVRTIGSLWHFLGRKGVPIAYTWPAGAGGLTGYTTDRESGEFTIFHLKMFLEDLAAHPDLEWIHILSHSRGTDVTETALRELAIAERAKGVDPRQSLKIRNLILASPDIDMEVASQRISSERLPKAVQRTTIYLSRADRALKLSSWLQGSWSRLGLMNVDTFTPAQLQALAFFPTVELIDTDIETDLIGHGYFYSNPSVSSDVILILRDDLGPGAENGRPLKPLGTGLWRIEEGYPGGKASLFDLIR